jgi:hypothetical protein
MTIRRCPVLLLFALTGCLVSFNDYPLGDPRADTEAGAGNGGSSAGSGGLPASGSGTGGKATGGSSTGVSARELMIDDFEDGNQAILQQQGRNGFWYISNDGQGMQTPGADAPFTPSALVPARAGSGHGAHTYGGPFSSWGALIGAAFVSNAGTRAPYDLSAYRGFRLWLRSGGMLPAAANKVRFNLLTSATIVGGTLCNDHFGADIPLTSSWTQIQVPFATLKQIGFGSPMGASVDTTHALGLELLFTTNVAFDLWLDDVELY